MIEETLSQEKRKEEDEFQRNHLYWFYAYTVDKCWISGDEVAEILMYIVTIRWAYNPLSINVQDDYAAWKSLLSGESLFKMKNRSDLIV